MSSSFRVKYSSRALTSEYRNAPKLTNNDPTREGLKSQTSEQITMLELWENNHNQRLHETEAQVSQATSNEERK